ncbi:MAG: helix-hairpin-helix domain-containing protein [Gammaproteobacteria bacterium]|nr:helix-hairpin-helix domain-containing protein [Gammaproteobacteria bacterium]
MLRTDIKDLQDIPNVGKSTEKYLHILGIYEPIQLAGQDPFKLYNDFYDITKKKHDPCLIDVFISAVNYMEGGAAKKWWEFTAERKIKQGTT